MIAVAGDYVVQASLPTSAALHQLPAPPGDFTGREAELDELIRKIEKGGVTISVLQGMGGIGKTALALKLADQLRPRYPDAQIYLDLKGTSDKPLTVAEAMAHVIRAYHPTAQLPEGEAELAALYHTALDGQCAILLMDNARGASQVAPLAPPASCVILVTSRWHFTLPGCFAKDLSVLPPEDAQKLLLAIAPRINGHAEEIAKHCGFLPLTLRAAGSALAETPNLSPADFARRLADARHRLELRDPTVDQTVEASLSLSYELLKAESQQRFRLLAVFPETFDVLGAASLWRTERDPAQDVLGELVRHSLVDWVEAEQRYRLHDLVRDFASARLASTERAQADRHHAAHYLGVTGVADKLYRMGGEGVTRGLALFDAEWANIQAGQAWVAAHADKDDEAARLCNVYPAAVFYFLILRRHPNERIEWLEAALGAAQQLKDRQAEGAHLGNLGSAYLDLGDPRRAIEYCNRHLAITLEIGDRAGQCTALGNLGSAFDDLGETRRAIEYYEQALAIARELGDRRAEGSILCGLGSAYVELGETRRAIEYYEQDLAIAREIGDRKGEGATLGNLGSAYRNLGEMRRAIECYEQDLAIAREMGNRRGEGITMGNLGIVYRHLGETGRAIEYLVQVLAIMRGIGDRRGEGNALGSLGITYVHLRETRRAIEYHNQQLAIAREIGDRRGEGNALGNLGTAYLESGEPRRAIEYFEPALAIDREVEDRRGEGSYLFDIGLALDDLGQRADAIAHAEAALKILEQIEDSGAEKVRRQLAQWRSQD